MAYQSTFCAVCQRACELESCVIDELGHAVHPSCYSKTVLHNVVRSRFDETEELLQQARELREMADKLIKKSDALIEAYKVTGQAKRLRPD